MSIGRESERVVADVAEALRARMGGLQRQRLRRADVLDAVYSFPCGVLGVHLCETWDELQRRWQEAQHELGSLMRSQGAVRGWGNDAYLLFVLAPLAMNTVGDREREDLLWKIRASASECLKDVLPLTEQWQGLLDDLSFVPLERFDTVPERASTAVSRILEQIGMCRELASDLAQVRPGAQRVAQQLDSGAYGDPPGEMKQPVHTELQEGRMNVGPSTPQAAGLAQKLRIQRLAITNFRSFRSDTRDTATEIDLSADFVLIYGENGSGKTSVVQAVEWALCGDVRCLREAVERESAEGYARAPLRNMWAESQSAEVCFALSDNRSFRRDEDGLHDPDGNAVGDEDLWAELLGVTRWRHQPITALRDRSSATFLLAQEQLRELLSDCPPDERLGRLSGLLGESGLGRATGKLRDVVTELRRILDEVRSERAALRERAETAESERTALAADLHGLGDNAGPTLTPTHYLECTREYHSAAGISADDLVAQPDAEETTRGAIRRIAEYLEGRRTALVSAIERVRRLGELSRELASARRTLTRLEQELGEAKLRHKEASEASSSLEEQASRLTRDLDELRVLTQQSVDRRTLIEQWLNAKPEVTTLRSQLSQVSQRISSLQQQIAALEDEVRHRSGAVDSARELLAAARLRYENGVNGVNRLVQLTQLLGQHGDISGRLHALQSEKAEIDASLATARELAGVARGRWNDATRRLSSLEERLGQIRTQRQVRDRLLQELREHVDSNECPLCSHGYATRQELLAMIEGRIGSPSAEEQSLLGDIQGEKASVDEARRGMADLDLQLSGLDRKCREIADAMVQISGVVAQIGTLCAGLGLPVDAGLKQVSARLKQRQDDLDLNKRDLTRREQDVASWERALEDTLERRRALSTELEQKFNEKRELDDRLGARMAELQVPEELQQTEDGVLADELERLGEKQHGLAQQMVRVDAECQRAAANRDIARETLAARQADAESAQQQVSEHAAMTARLESDLRVVEREQLGIDAEHPQQELSKVECLVSDGRSVLRMLDVAAIRRRLTCVEERIASLTNDGRRLDERAAGVAKWQQTCEYAATVLQREEAHVVEDGLEPIRGFTRRIHGRLARHPIFSQVDWSIDDTGLRFWAEPRPGSGHDARLVQAYMNEAQQNIVALSIFLASALCRGGNLRTVVLDDPVQAMDEVNIYGLLDLLRQASSQAQVIMTTGRNDLFHLARAKFACLNRDDARRFRAYRLRWGGPGIGTLVDDVT